MISISQQRMTVTVFVGQSRYQLESIADVLAKTNQAVSTLETYRARLEQVLTRLTALEFQNAVVLDDVLVTLQRAEMTTRMAEEIERDCVELGEEGRLIRMQLEELVADVPDEKGALVHDYHADGGVERTREGLEALGGASVPASCSSSRFWPRCSATRPRSTRSTTPSRRAVTASCRTFRGCRTASSSRVVSSLPGLEAIVRATRSASSRRSRAWGPAAAREIREGLRRLAGAQPGRPLPPV